MLQGNDIDSLTPNVLLELRGDDCMYLIITCNTVDIAGKHAKIEVRNILLIIWVVLLVELDSWHI